MHKHPGRMRKGIYVLGLTAAFLVALLAFLSFFTNDTGHPLAVLEVAPPTGDIAPDVPAYIEVTVGCDSNYAGACVNARATPTTTASLQARLRTGVVLPVASTTAVDETGRSWYRIVFNEWLRYPERMHGDWYVAADVVEPLYGLRVEELAPAAHIVTSSKRILIDRSEQMLYAYDGKELFLQTPISTGLEDTPTPRGTFRVFRKTPSRYMQGPLPGISDQYYDLPGVPWNLYFTHEGGAIHGAYWHANFGQQWSHGCVNVPLAEAKLLYEWTPIGTPVTVQD